LADFWTMAQRFPRVRFILAHWGGALWRDPAGNGPHRQLPENVWVDTAATPLLYGSPIWSEGMAACGSRKILWGTDYPLDLYPKEPGRGTFKGLLTEAQERMKGAADPILGENTGQLLGLPGCA
jgi:predicted TIM-barrel fold metal-dependent hydrolase